MRNAFADEATKLADKNDNLVILSGDIGNRLFDAFKVNHQDKFFNCGIAEGNMMGVAAGMALSGLRPIVYTITPFTTTRCYEQIRIDACYHNVPVIIVGTGSGLSYAELGPTHHSLEDFAILRVLPNITILSPADEIELRNCLREALTLQGPTYIRIGKKGEEIISKGENFKIGKSITVKSGTDICLIGTGTLMPTVLKSAENLSSKGFSVRVEKFHTIKPIDTKSLQNILLNFPLVAVIEEHSHIGGLFGTISEHLAQQNIKCKLVSFSVKDEFMHETGTQDYARNKYGLTVKNITKQIISSFAELNTTCT